MITSVLSLAYKLIAPAVPAGTKAALATGIPSCEPSVAASGKGDPAGQAVRNPSGPGGNTPILSEYACAVPGTSQLLDGIGKLRVAPPTSDGGPNAPVKPSPVRVSAI